MTRANTEQAKFVPWFAKAGAACSIVPIARFIGPNIFALKGAGYGCLFALAFATTVASASGPGTPDAKHLQPNAPRTITVSEADTPPVVRAGLLQSTLILLPDQEKVANVFAGDTVDPARSSRESAHLP